MENQRAKGSKIGRVAVERLCAGPAVPMIYAFMKEKYPQLESNLEKRKHFDEIYSKDIIDMAIKERDPLCLKVVEKLTFNFGTETGNLGLSALPFGGIYLIGGVTAGLKDYILSKEGNEVFMAGFSDKGRLNQYMKDNFSVFLVDPSLEVGIDGAKEKARREMKRIERAELDKLMLGGKKGSFEFGKK